MITYNLNSGSLGTYLTSATFDSWFTISNPTRTGYTFSGWVITGMDTITHYYGTSTSSYKTTTATSISYDKSTWFKNLITTGGPVKFEAKWSANTYYVAYNANGGSGSMSTSTHTYDTAKALTANGFTKTGYSFEGWSTSSSGSVVYVNKASVINLTSTPGATFTLYAKWTVNSYTVSINPNGGTYNSSTSTSTRTCTFDTGFTVSNPTRTGYTFSGWIITGMDDECDHYYGTSASSYKTTTAISITYDKSTWFKNLRSSSGTVTFKAGWSPNTYYVAFNANSGSGSMSNQTFKYGTAQTLTANAFSRAGYKFVGWSRSSTATTITYSDKQSVSNLTTSGTVTLYAVWASTGWTQLTLNANGGTSNDSHVYYYGYGTDGRNEGLVTRPWITEGERDYTYSVQGLYSLPTRSGYTFDGYYTEASGGTSMISTYGEPSSELFSIPGHNGYLTLYAHWTVDSSEVHTVTFDANGGSGGLTKLYFITGGSYFYTDSACTNVYDYRSDFAIPYKSGYALDAYYEANGAHCYFDYDGTYNADDEDSDILTWAQDAEFTAHWRDYIIVNLNKQSGSGGTSTYYVEVDYLSGWYSDSSCTTSITSITIPTRSGYTFGGYWTGIGGTGVQHVGSSGNLLWPEDQDDCLHYSYVCCVTLYAYWIAN